MALTSQQMDYLRTADQRFRAKVAVFNAFTLTATNPAVADEGEQLAPLPLPRMSSRYSVVAYSGDITLDATESRNRDGSYVGDGNVAWSLESGGGSLVDNSNGTATYTAPAAGVDLAEIKLTVTNGNGSKDSYAYISYPDTTFDDEVAEIATITGGVEQHGWKMTLRVAGSASAFTLNKGVLLHVEDTWNATTSTFGGHRYAEGVFFGYISDVQGFEDGAGDYWTGLEIRSPWWLLERVRVGETWWSLDAQSGSFYLEDFAPADAVWHFLNSITNWSEYHDTAIWTDGNIVDDLIIHASDLGTIVLDVMGRSLGIAYCDRYGNLFCVPDPDVRADEYWGTPAPMYTSEDSGGGPLSETLVTSRSIRYLPYQTRRLTLEAYDRSRMGIFAISENATAPGTEASEGGLLCDDASRLASWAVQKRAQMNRAWEVDVTVPLNHTIDICSFVDVCFTAGRQTNPPTASGRTWVSQVTYRPDLYRGSWQGSWKLLKQTEGDGEAETGGLSGWGGSGYGYTGNARYTGDNGLGDGWGSATGGETGWCIEFNFKEATGSWQYDDFTPPGDQMGTWASATGYEDALVYYSDGGNYQNWIGILYDFGKVVDLTNVAISGAFTDSPIAFGTQFVSGVYDGGGIIAIWAGAPSGATAWEWNGDTAVTIFSVSMGGQSGESVVLEWMRMQGKLPAPFTGTGNCT